MIRKLAANNLDLYLVRSSILKALKSNLHNFSGRFCDIGAGHWPYRDLLTESTNVSEYLSLDLHDNRQHTASQHTWDGVVMPFADDSFDSARNDGFIDIQLTPTGGWNPSLAQVIGLWLRRRPMGRMKRKLLSSLFFPVFRLLAKRDEKQTSSFDRGCGTGTQARK